MSTLITHETGVPTGHTTATRTAQVSGPAFDWTATALSGVFITGIFLDGWAHSHGMVDDTFFTPWHAVLYSGYLVVAMLLIGRAAWSVARGRSTLMPAGYGWALAGIGFWVVGGPFDLAWHTVFGFEADVEALMSPAHAVLAVGAGLMQSGSLRAGLQRLPRRWRDELPMILSLTFLVSNLTFFTQIAHPISNLWAAGPGPVRHAVLELGIVGMLLTAAILWAPVLLLLRHGRLPAGSITILVTLNAIAMGFLYDRGPYPLTAVLALAAGAVVVDVVRMASKPAAARPRAFRAFAAAAPVLVYAAYYAALSLTTGIAWSTHVWVGVVVFTGIIGWLLSYVVLPPRLAAGPDAAA
jgi:hypothetical protein